MFGGDDGSHTSSPSFYRGNFFNDVWILQRADTQVYGSRSDRARSKQKSGERGVSDEEIARDGSGSDRASSRRENGSGEHEEGVHMNGFMKGDEYDINIGSGSKSSAHVSSNIFGEKLRDEHDSHSSISSSGGSSSSSSSSSSSADQPEGTIVEKSGKEHDSHSSSNSSSSSRSSSSTDQQEGTSAEKSRNHQSGSNNIHGGDMHGKEDVQTALWTWIRLFPATSQSRGIDSNSTEIPSVPDARAACASFMHGSCMYIAFGYNGKAMNDMWRLCFPRFGLDVAEDIRWENLTSEVLRVVDYQAKEVPLPRYQVRMCVCVCVCVCECVCVCVCVC
jgi:hypothetical protein